MKDSNPFEAPKESPGKIDEPLDAAEEQTDNIGFTAQMVRLTALHCRSRTQYQICVANIQLA